MCVGGRRFTVLRLLGRGKGGYSFLVTDADGQYVLKQIHHEPCAYYSFGDKLAAEQSDYARLLAAGIRMPRLLDVDVERECLLKEYIEGSTVAAHLLSGTMRPAYRAQIEAMCQKLYPLGLNIDYFPTNFVVRGGLLYYVDYECNAYHAQWDFAHWGAQYWDDPAALRAALDAQQAERP